jgi:hypothetical protein
MASLEVGLNAASVAEARIPDQIQVNWLKMLEDSK